MKLWIDDLRPPPEGWEWARYSVVALLYLHNHDIEEVSFDHDMGRGDTTRSVVLWLCEHPDRWPKVCRVHSMNPVGAEWLEGMINRYGPGLTR